METQIYKGSHLDPFVGLKDVMEVERRLSSSDDDCLSETSEKIISMGLARDLNIDLLHTHFDLEQGELWIQNVSKEGNSLISKPFKGDTNSLRPIPISWRFTKIGTGDFKITPLLFCTNEHPLFNELQEKLSIVAPQLSEIASVFDSHGKLDRFGVSLFSQPIQLSKDETLLEYTILDSREIVIVRCNRKDAVAKNHIQTSWRVEGTEKNNLICIVRCSDAGGNANHFETHGGLFGVSKEN